MSHTWARDQPLRILRKDSAGMDFHFASDEEAWVKFMKKCATLERKQTLTYGSARDLTYIYYRPYGRPVVIVRRAIACGIFQVVRKKTQAYNRGRVVVRDANGDVRFEVKP